MELTREAARLSRWLNRKESTCNPGDTGGAGSIPGSGGSPGGGRDSPLQDFAWRIPWTEEPGGPQSMGLHSQTRLKRLITRHAEKLAHHQEGPHSQQRPRVRSGHTPHPWLEWEEEEAEARAGVPGPLCVLSCKPERKKTRRKQGARVKLLKVLWWGQRPWGGQGGP